MMTTPGSSLFDTVKADLPASVVVFLVAVPLCLGIALASGAPLFSGIIAGIVGGIVVGAASGSQLGVSGPAAGLAVIVLNAIATLGSFQTFLLSVVIAGAIQIALGYALRRHRLLLSLVGHQGDARRHRPDHHPQAAPARRRLRRRARRQPGLCSGQR
jgi:hypothetical protein